MLLAELPLELLLVVLSSCPRHALAQLLRVNHYLHDVAIRVLYTTIPRLSIENSTQCFTALCFNDFTCTLVKTLVISWESVLLQEEIAGRGTVKNVARYGLVRAVTKRHLLRNRVALLRTLLQRVSNLTSLTLVTSPRDSLSDIHPSVILSKSTFSLTYFKTSFVVGRGVSTFLEGQPNLKELYLDGMSNFSRETMPLLHVCPRLERFTWFHWRHQVPLLETFIKDRPLKHIAIVLRHQYAQEIISMLGSVAPNLESLVFTLRDPLHEDLLEYTTSHLPSLRQLKLSLPTMPPKEVIDSMAAFTSRPRTLQSLCMVIRGLSPVDGAANKVEILGMRYIVAKWVSSCSTLEVIHFPDISKRQTKKTAHYDFMQTDSTGCCEGTCLTVKGRGRSAMVVVSLSRGPCVHRRIDVAKSSLVAYLNNKM